MNGGLVILFSVSIAFVWVYVLKIGRVKPFNCMKCMSHWIALGLAFGFGTEYWYLWGFVGAFAGAMFDQIKGRL